MKGLELKLSPNKRAVEIKLEPLLLESGIEAIAVVQAFNQSKYSGYFLDESAVLSVCDAFKQAQENNEMEPIEFIIAQAIDAEIEIGIAGDKMVAEVTLTSPFMGDIPSVDDIFNILANHEVVRGISKKRIKNLIDKTAKAEGGRHFSDLVAKGLPPRMGKDSYIKALIPDALERMLTPKITDDEKVNMRDFGEIICVKANQTIAQRMPPTTGRAGFTVIGKELPSEPGNWKQINLGEHAYIEETQENLVLAKIAGLPKVSNAKVDVDNVFVSKGVNVATGNINFDGSIIINGDITEKMQVVAKGDVTVNGFVESAYIEAGGNIIITQGASGKLQNVDCEFKSGGSIYVGHAQGVSIHANGDLIVDKQLAYSNVSCKGHITVGKINNPLGKVFASTIKCNKSISAGHVGAVSGSSLILDYSESYNKMIETHDRLVEQFESLSSTNADHEIKISKIKNRKPSAALKEKLALVTQELELERVFLNWLRINVDESKELIDNFAREAKVIANRALHHGVTIKLNNKKWQAKEEYKKCQIVLDNKDWVYEPLI
jgi:uncharacterized protein (DUF342 family)